VAETEAWAQGEALEPLRAYCLGKPGVEESYPFGPGALVMKVGGKLFAIIADESDPLTVSLKCEPEIAVILRSRYPAVGPGYHLNKRHWNTVTLDGSIPEEEVLEWIDDSYDLVLEALPRNTRTEVRARGK
jgi:predicted DNA-binding protein (MmcQ/YjbR family)